VCHQNSAAYIPQFDDSCGIKDTQIGYETPQKGEDNHAGGGSSSYYELPSDCQTLQDIIVKKGMDFTRGNIFKAVYRWDSKPSLQYNLEKIVWFAQDALNRIYAEQKRNLHGSGND
jgi:hypothetical protein